MTAGLSWTRAFEAGLAANDPAIQRLIAAEEERNTATINLIASESYSPLATVEAEASILVNKNTTGYPEHRTVAGCGIANQIEELARQRALALFGAEHANVQALSSTIANIAVLRGLLKPGASILALRESAGGHHSHGAHYHVSGIDYRSDSFGVDETAGGIDLDEARRKAKANRPAMIIAGATAYPRAIDFRGLRAIADEVGAVFFADIAHVAGLVVTGHHDNPAAYADVVTTSTHKTFCGPRTGGLILCRKAHAAVIDEALFPSMQGAPGAHIIAGRAVLFELVRRPFFHALMNQVVSSAKFFAEALKAHGIPLYLGGTDTHMVVIDMRLREVEGAALARSLEEHNLLGNIVSLPRRDGDRSRIGIRVGTNAMTIRGFREEQWGVVANTLAAVLRAPDAFDSGTARAMADCAASFPIPTGFIAQRPSSAT